jgi:hypothetical protein
MPVGDGLRERGVGERVEQLLRESRFGFPVTDEVLDSAIHGASFSRNVLCPLRRLESMIAGGKRAPRSPDAPQGGRTLYTASRRVGAVQAKGITIPVHGDTATGRKMNERFLREAIELAFEGMRAGQGGPFGAVIVRDGEIIGRGCNRVTSTNDPTAHAEIVAIREACQNAAHFHLPGAVLYASCEPCPMCLAAI